MALITGLTQSGESWTPEFVQTLNQQSCIGCGRCYNVCTRSVFAPEEIEVDDDDYDDDVRMVMGIANQGSCIGCGACAKACAKNCFTFAPQEA